MKFRNYTIIVLGDTSGVRELVRKISETQARCLETSGVFISTFTTNMEAIELKEIFYREKRTFFIMPVDETTACQMGKDDIHEQLFGYIENSGDEVLNFMSDSLMNDIRDNRVSGGTDPSRTGSIIIQEEMPLDEQLQMAIQDEDYEEAARIRDEIDNKG